MFFDVVPCNQLIWFKSFFLAKAVCKLKILPKCIFVHFSRFCLKLYAKSPSAYQLLQEVLVLPAPRLLRSERNKSGYLQIGLQKEVLLRISNAAASSGKRCDSMAVVAFDEMTIKGT